MSKVTTNARNETVPFSEEVVQDMLMHVADGHSLASICGKPGYPSRKSFFKWVADKPGIAEQYQVALSMRAELFADQIIEISDDTDGDIGYDKEGNERVDNENIQRSKLRVDARKWVASRLLPKKYGDKIELDNKHSGEVKQNIEITLIDGNPGTGS